MFVTFSTYYISYILIVKTSFDLDVFKDFAALAVINTFDDIVGRYLASSINNYSNFMKFRAPSRAPFAYIISVVEGEEKYDRD